jgi:hypothetical protein
LIPESEKLIKKKGMFMGNKFVVFLMLIILILTTCGTESEADNSTKEDWETNIALRHEYRNKLIFTATETTSPTGKKGMSLVAHNRDSLISIFERLQLEGVPSMDERRDDILKMIKESSGGERVNMSGKLATDISNFWDKVLKYAEKHGVSPEK